MANDCLAGTGHFDTHSPGALSMRTASYRDRRCDVPSIYRYHGLHLEKDRRFEMLLSWTSN